VSSIVFHVDKKTGTRYAYESISYRDPVSKKPRSKQKYLGKFDPETNTIIRTNRRKKHNTPEITAKGSKSTITEGNDTLPQDFKQIGSNVTVSSMLVGTHLFMELISEKLQIKPLLQKHFPAEYEMILSTIYYLVSQGRLLSNIDKWSKNHIHPFNRYITIPQISSLLSDISMDNIQEFLYAWSKKFAKEDMLLYDITSISSYAKTIHHIRRGNNPDMENFEQINLALICGRKSLLPAHYRTIRGSISDVSSLEKTFEYFNSQKIKTPTYVLDKSFESISNIDYLLRNNFTFLIPLPPNISLISPIIDSYYDDMLLPDNYFRINDEETIYIITHKLKLFEIYKPCYLHIYYQPEIVEKDLKEFMDNLITLKEQIEMNDINKNLFSTYKAYLKISKTPEAGITVRYNYEKIKTHRDRYYGFFCLLSPNIKDPLECLQIYRNRDIIENYFDDLKNLLDEKHLRIKYPNRMEARLFIQFLSLIYSSMIRSIIYDSKSPLKNMSLRAIFDELEILTEIIFHPDGSKFCNDTDKQTKKILDLFRD
jgi:transposase